MKVPTLPLSRSRSILRAACQTAAVVIVAGAASAVTGQTAPPASPNTPVLPSRDAVAPAASPNTPSLAAPAPSTPAPLPSLPTPAQPRVADGPALAQPTTTNSRIVGPPSPFPVRRGGDVSILPGPIEQPLAIDTAGDPVLTLARTTGSGEAFRAALIAAVEQNPSRAEADARLAEAVAARREARMGLFPTVDVNITGYRVLARDFRAELDNIVERSRPRARTDATASLNQTLFDFGGTFDRIGGAADRIRATTAYIDDTSSQIALQAIAAWYDVYSARTRVDLVRAYRAAQDDRRRELQQRIAQGVNATTDMSRLDSTVSRIDQRAAQFDRDLANAEARYRQLTGMPAPVGLQRAPLLGKLPATIDEARFAAGGNPQVIAAEAQSDASKRDARAAHAETLPYISAGVVAGRYGVLEKERDYDVRGVLTLRQRFFGAGDARADQADARATSAAARASRIREETARDAAVALSDLQALDRQLEALRTAYIAARVSRDATEERFRVSRGTLFDAIDANDTYFGAAALYIEALTERDAAHYVLLARTGRLLEALGIASAQRQGINR